MGHSKNADEVMFGPITLAMSFPFVAWVFRLPGAPTVCMTAHVDDHGAILKEPARWLEVVLTDAKRRYAQWPDLPCLHAHVGPDRKALRVGLYEGSEMQPDEIGKAILRTLTVTFERTIDGIACEVTQFAPEPGKAECRYEYRLKDHPERAGFMYLADEPDRLDAALRTLVQVQDSVKEVDLGLYALEATHSDPLAAFHSFHHALRLAGPANRAALVPVGLDLGKRLLAIRSWDYADWVAGATATLADACDRPADALSALQIEGVACSRLGTIDATIGCFEGVLARLARVEDPWLAARMHMSYGLSLMDMLMHWETLDVDTRRAGATRLLERLALAERELQAARTRFSAIDVGRAQRDIGFIDLELLRIRDLRGDHAGALNAFDAAARAVPARDKRPLSDADIDAVKHEGTRLHYRLAAAIKLAESDETGAPVPGDEIARTVEAVNRLPTQYPVADRLCCLMVLASQRYLELALDLRSVEALARAPSADAVPGDVAVPELTDDERAWLTTKLGEVEHNLSEALKIRGSFERNNVRPPRSGVEYGGLPAIDITGLLQQTRLLLAEARNDAGRVWDALSTADEVKGRFFQRDLVLTTARAPDRTPVMAAEALADLRASLVSGLADHRVVMAEFDHTIRHELPKEEAERYAAETRFDLSPNRDEVQALLEADGIPTGLIFFYATARETLVYVVTPGAGAPQVARLAISAAAVERAAARWQGDLRGYPLTGDADANRVLDGLRQMLERFLSLLLPLARIALCAHGPWHGIPVHVVLLQLLWAHDRDTGVVHVPSLRAWQLLQKRRRAMARSERRPIALTTAPAREDIAAMFAHEHERLRALLDRTGRGVSAAFAEQATVQRGLDDLRACGIHHFLAHGIDGGLDHAMESGMLLATERDGLPSRAGGESPLPPRLASDRHAPARASDSVLTAALMMANGTSASHVTLQACSIGRQAAAFRDELWGVTRALLAGGTNTVLAPLWDLDLQSSSELVGRFYALWLLHDVPPWRALARAQRDMAEGTTEAFRHFSHWGALQLVGS